MPKVAARTAGLKKNYHHTFEIRKDRKTVVRHTLLLNPQSLSQAELARATVTQTLGGAYVTDFGAALPTVSIGGTTGYAQRYNADGELRDGYEEFVHFRTEVYRKFIETNDPSYEIFWYNWEDEEYWRIQPTSFRLQRSTAETLLYRYEFAFTCTAKASVVGVKTDSGMKAIDAKLMQDGINSIKQGVSNINEILLKFKGGH